MEQSDNPLFIKGHIPASLLQFNGLEGKEMLKFMPNGDVFVFGRLATNDMEIVEGIRSFLLQTGHIKIQEKPPLNLKLLLLKRGR
jgi:hypothetical protein